jgi:hypothetical protein
VGVTLYVTWRSREYSRRNLRANSWRKVVQYWMWQCVI